MAEGIKPYTLPTGLVNQLDPSAAEVAYINGMSRAGVPAGLLQMGMNDARSAREEWVRQLFGASEDIQNRTQATNNALMQADAYKTNLGAYIDIAKADNPNQLRAAMVPLAGIEGIDPRVRSLLGMDASAAADHRVLGDRAKRFENVGSGVRQMAEGGYRPEWNGVNFDTLLGSPMQKHDPIDIERERITQAGKTARETLPQYTTELDPDGNVVKHGVRSGDPGTTMDMVTRGRQRLGTGGDSNPSVSVGEPTVAPKEDTGADIPVPRSVSQQENAMAEIASGKNAATVVYGGVKMTPSIAEQARIADTGGDKWLGNAKPDPAQRGWTMTPTGYVRDFITPDGKRKRIKLLPLPGDGVYMVPQNVR